MSYLVQFIGINQKYTQDMIKQKPSGSSIRYEGKQDSFKVAMGKALLHEYFKRPNMELYRLLDETGHYFQPFEKDLKDVEYVNCQDPLIVISSLCKSKIDLELAATIQPEIESSEVSEIESDISGFHRGLSRSSWFYQSKTQFYTTGRVSWRWNHGFLLYLAAGFSCFILYLNRLIRR